MTTIYLLTHGQYDDRHPVAAFSTLDAAKAAVSTDGWHEWDTGRWNNKTWDCDIEEIPFGALPDGWHDEQIADQQRDRALRDRHDRERAEEEARVAAMTRAERDEYLRERALHSFATTTAVVYASPRLG